MSDGTGVQNLKRVIRKLRPTCPPPPQGLCGDLCDRLEMALLQCTPTDLTPLFLDGRIHQWRDDVPQAATPVDRARALIDFLFSHADAQGHNGLLLFLDVLNDRTDPRDACHRRIYLLRCDLRQQNLPKGTR